MRAGNFRRFFRNNLKLNFVHKEVEEEIVSGYPIFGRFTDNFRSE